MPNFGVDQDIVTTQNNIAAEEKRQKHSWTPQRDENGVWLVPEPNANNWATQKSLVQTEADVEIESDPVCSSAGCNYASEKGKTTHPMNYFVPNFGADRDINHSFNSLEWAEKKLGHKWNIDWKAVKAKGPPQDYFVPNFGVDEDIKMTQANVAEQEKVIGHQWNPVQDENGVWLVPEANKPVFSQKTLLQTDAQVETGSDPVCSSAGCNYNSEKPPKTHPMDYFVPNFGRDHDINTTWSSLAWAEGKHKHIFNPISQKEAKKQEHPVDYPVPDFGLDEEVVETQKNIADQEKLLQHEWKPVKDENGVYQVPVANDNASYTYKSLVQTDAQINLEKRQRMRYQRASDPICSSANWPCEQNKSKSPYPINYKVPDFGIDHDIITTQNHIASEEKRQNHKWVPKKDDTGAWNVPSALAQSDPICHSAGCEKSVWFKQEKTPFDDIEYPDLVKKYGYDEDIIDSVGNEMMVSKAMGIPFNIPQYAQLESSSDPVCHSAGCTQYNWMDKLREKATPPVEYATGQPLEQDVINTWDNLGVAEKIKNHEWKFNQDVYNTRNKEAAPTEYDFDAGLDEDILNTQSHLSAAETKLGDWDIFKNKK